MLLQAAFCEEHSGLMDAIAAAQDAQRRVSVVPALDPAIIRIEPAQPAPPKGSFAALDSFLGAPMRDSADGNEDSAQQMPDAPLAAKRGSDLSDSAGHSGGKRRRVEGTAGPSLAAEHREDRGEAGAEVCAGDSQAVTAAAITQVQRVASAQTAQHAASPVTAAPGAFSASTGKRKAFSGSAAVLDGAEAKRRRQRSLLQESQTEYVRVQSARRGSHEGN